MTSHQRWWVMVRWRNMRPIMWQSTWRAMWPVRQLNRLAKEQEGAIVLECRGFKPDDGVNAKTRTMTGSRFVGSLTVDGSRVWLHYPQPEYQGWDFGALGSSPVHLSNMPTLHLNGTIVWDISQSTIKDTATGKTVFQLSGRFANPVDVRCDGCYLVAGYSSGEILILDFSHVFS